MSLLVKGTTTELLKRMYMLLGTKIGPPKCEDYHLSLKSVHRNNIILGLECLGL